jgi:hypothetical protein
VPSKMARFQIYRRSIIGLLNFVGHRYLRHVSSMISRFINCQSNVILSAYEMVLHLFIVIQPKKVIYEFVTFVMVNRVNSLDGYSKSADDMFIYYDGMLCLREISVMPQLPLRELSVSIMCVCIRQPINNAIL